MTTPLRRVGLIGGTSWVSSEHYYRRLNTLVAERAGALTSAPVTLWSLEFGEFARLQHAGDWAGVGRVLADAARGLVGAGCEGIALAANTTHLVADDVRAAIGDTPLIDLVHETTRAVADYRTVGLLGTAFTMSAPMFPDSFAARGVQTVLPADVDRQRVHDVIYGELAKNIISDQARADYLTVIDKLVAEGAEAVVLACTEQGLLLRDGEGPVPFVDTTEVHCRALVDFIFSEGQRS